MSSIQDAKSLSTEKAILGCCLLNPEVIDAVDVEVRDFYDPKNRIVWEAIMEVGHEAAGDVIVLEEHLRREGHLDAIGGLPYLVDCTDHPALPSTVHHHADTLRRLRVTRQTLLLASKVPTWHSHGDEGEELLARLVRDASTIDTANTDRPLSLHDAVATEFREINAFCEARDRGENVSVGIPTGIGGWDKLSGGILIGEPTILGARPGIGKSTVSLILALNAAARGYPVHLISYEDRIPTLIQRSLANYSMVDSRLIKVRDFSEDGAWARVNKAGQELRQLPGIVFDEAHGRPMHWVCRRVRGAMRQNQTRLVIVDYIQAAPSPRPGIKRHLGVAENTRALVELCGSNRLGVVIVSQLRRNDAALPTIDDLAESDVLTQAGKLIVLLHEGKDGDVCLLVRKNIQGPTGKIEIDLDRARCRIRG